MLNMCNTILTHFDCSHVSIEFLCIHTYMQTYEQGHACNKSTVRNVLNSQEKKKENKKKVMNTKSNTNHAALATQVERQIEKKPGRAAARRNAPKLPRAIGVGPYQGPQNFGVVIPGVYLIVSTNTGGLSDFY